MVLDVSGLFVWFGLFGLFGLFGDPVCLVCLVWKGFVNNVGVMEFCS